MPFREALFCRAMVVDKGDAGHDQYLLLLGYDHYSMRSMTQRLAYARHIGGCFCGFPDDYFPRVGNKTDNAPWSAIVQSRFDQNGKWRGGKERGFLYRFKNLGSAREPCFEGSGTLDVLFGTILGKNEPVQKGRVPAVRWIENTGTPALPRFGRIGEVTFNVWPLTLGRHTPAPCLVDLSGDGEGEMLIGIDCGALLVFESSEIRFERGSQWTGRGAR